MFFNALMQVSACEADPNENTTLKVETCIHVVDLFIKAAENHQIGIPNS